MREDPTRCKHCGHAIYKEFFRWRHTNGMYTCTLQIPRPRPRAAPQDDSKEEADAR